MQYPMKNVWRTGVVATVAVATVAAAATFGFSDSSTLAASGGAALAQQTVPNESTITVSGYGSASAPADEVFVRLTTGGESSYGPSGPEFEPMDERDMQTMVDLLVEAGVDEETVFTDSFARSNYGSYPAGEVSFTYGEPGNLNEFLGDYQSEMESSRGPQVGAGAAIFLIDDCAATETEAIQMALEDARSRAERMAAEAGVELGEIVSLSEGPSGAIDVFGASSTGGCAAIEAATRQSSFGIGGPGLNSADRVDVSVVVQVVYAMGE